MERSTQVLVGGAGASGLVCALTAARAGRQVIVLDHRQRPGDRIAVSGGGSCNFSNRKVGIDDFVSDNPRFLYSPLKAFPPQAAIRFFSELGLTPVEREHGQLFFRQGGDLARKALVAACLKAGCIIETCVRITEIIKDQDAFCVVCKTERFTSQDLVLACGGLAAPGLGASDLGYRLARQFGHRIIPTAPGLVPLIFSEQDQNRFSPLSGISLPVACRLGKRTFRDQLLFTRRGLSGPVILSLSNSWTREQIVCIDWLPGTNLDTALCEWKRDFPRGSLRTRLAGLIPKRLTDTLYPESLLQKKCAQLTPSDRERLLSIMHSTRLTPARRDGFDKAEVTRGGVDTREIDSRTMQSRMQNRLYIIGELLDITGNLGGFNLHWAWCSGILAGFSLQNEKK